MSALEEAVVASLASSMSPTAGITRTWAMQQVKESDMNLDERRLSMMAKLEEAIERVSKKTGHDPKVVAAYQRMLDKYSTP